MILGDKVRDVLASELEALNPSLLVMTDITDYKAVANVLAAALEDILAEKIDDLYSAIIERELDILMYRSRLKGQRALFLLILSFVGLLCLVIIFIIYTG